MNQFFKSMLISHKCYPRFFINTCRLLYVRHFQGTMLPDQIRDYQGAVEALNNLQTNAQYIRNAVNSPNSMTNIAEVTKFLRRSGVSLEHLDKLSVIHITGTNGKGSTCAYCENILRNHGYKTGFYSSPHLLDVRERIRVNGKPISKTEFSSHFWKIYDLLDKQKANPGDMPLYFRFLTILAFHVFLNQGVDVAIIEVGIGGEYDCTNVIRKTAIAGITPLDMDHTALLGNSLEEIAWNKSGIMKEGCLALSTKQPENVLRIFQERSLERKCTFKVLETEEYFGSDSNIPFHVQKTNASLALAISEAYIRRDSNSNLRSFSVELAKKSLEEAYWPGRYEIKQIRNITFFLDGAHTVDSINICTDWFLDKTKNSNSRKVLVFNLTGARDPGIFFEILKKCEFHTVIFTPNVGSEKDPADIADYIFPQEKQLKRCEDYKNKWLEMQSANKLKERVHVTPSFSKAVKLLDSETKYSTLVTGSIHLIGSALSVLDPTLNGILE